MVTRVKLLNTEQRIISFTGQFKFLSNFWPCKVVLDGQTYSTIEHAYQAAKTLDFLERKKIQEADTASKAKKLGTRVTLQENWIGLKNQVMNDLLVQKFARPSLLFDFLNETKEKNIIEGNWWHDLWFGKCFCSTHEGDGENHLGVMLMNIRDNTNG